MALVRAGLIAALFAQAAAQAPTTAPTAAPTAAPTSAPTFVDTPSCFAMEATVQVAGVEGAQPLSQLRVGDRVLANGMYTDVVGFLHNLQESSDMVVVEHAAGELRVTSNHVLFVDGQDKEASAVKIGDALSLADGSVSQVVAVRHDLAGGLVSPLTASGMIDVDEATSSNYANVHGIEVPHAAMHAAFALARAASGFFTMAGAHTISEKMPKLAGAVRMLS
eukprot:TRINITY_DN4330_c0_g2_i2.p1 TRINITY_DN4330_c0_g2~~TRINITY_DN4330_c0_g2_i2.p1  ORF type:complete len:253 (-),score=44.81 TRINITY_DN4330_c0_g2_i2:250-915(-)